jgi:hypothetical protein
MTTRPVPATRAPDSRPRCILASSRRPRGEEKAKRNNLTFKNRRNSFTTQKKTFSNRNKNTTSGSPHFRPRPGILITKTRLEIDAND